MPTSDAARYANRAEVIQCYAHFTRLVAVVADRHQAYLAAQGLRLADCYQVTFRAANAHLHLQPGLPFTLHEELRQCFVVSFG